MKRNILELEVETNLRPIVNKDDQSRISNAFDFWELDEEEEREHDVLVEHEYGRMSIDALRRDMAAVYGEDTVTRVRNLRSDLYRPQKYRGKLGRYCAAKQMFRVAAAVVLICVLFGGLLAVSIRQVEGETLVTASNELIELETEAVVQNILVEPTAVGGVVDTVLKAISGDVVAAWRPIDEDSGFFLIKITESHNSVYSAINRLLDANAFEAVNGELAASNVDTHRMPEGDIVFGFLSKVGQNEYRATVAYLGAQSRTDQCSASPIMVSKSGLQIEELSNVLSALHDRQNCAPIVAGVSFIPNFFPDIAYAETVLNNLRNGFGPAVIHEANYGNPKSKPIMRTQ